MLMPKSLEKRRAGFTQIELAVVVVLMALLILWVVPTIFEGSRYSRSAAQRICCINNLKQIGLAYRVWASDNGDLFPAQSSTNGWKNLLTNGAAGSYCWTNFALMHTELGESPKILICPADERQAAQSIVPQKGAQSGLSINNTNISYFVGVGANPSFPQTILGGDRNLCSGLKPSKNYGFSFENGLGADVAIQTNFAAAPISWSLKMHASKRSAGAGNLLLGDGSVQSCSTSVQLRQYQSAALDSGNWPSNAIPKAPSFRLVFP